MPKLIQVDGVGPVEFPDDATEAEMRSAVEPLIPLPSPRPSRSVADVPARYQDEYVSHPALPLPGTTVAEEPGLPPLPPITAEQLSGGPPPGPGLLDRFNRLFALGPLGPPTVTNDMTPEQLAQWEANAARPRLLESVQRAQAPVSIGLRESAVRGVNALTSPAGAAIAGAATVAPEVALPAIFATTLPQVPDVVENVVKHSRFGSEPDPLAYYNAVGDALQTGGVLAGTARATGRVPSLLDAWRESVAARAEARFNAARDITPEPPAQLTDRGPTPPSPEPTVLEPRPRPRPPAPRGPTALLSAPPAPVPPAPVPAPPVEQPGAPAPAPPAAPAPEARIVVTEHPDGFKVSGLSVPPEARGRGIGTAKMREVIEQANAAGKPVFLTAVAESPAMQPALNRFYERLGFKHYRDDPLSGKPMYRHDPPTAPAAPASVPPAAQSPIADIIASADTPQAKSAALRKLAADQGRPIKDVQEAVESEVVAQAHAIAVNPALAPLGKFTQLIDLYNRQPTLSARTSTSVELQAYSTPAPLSYALSYAAGITPDAPVYDATAGNGMLLIGSNVAGGHGNELDPKRQASLQRFGVGTVTPHDATTYTPGTSYPFVQLNPPFGSIPNVNFGGYGITRLEHIIALRALDALQDDGVGSIIMGARREEGPGGKGAQWVFENYVYGHYNVVANFEVAGDLYAKQGAKWPVRVIVVAGRRQLPIGGELAPKEVARYDSWSDVWREAERIRSEIDRRRSSVVPGAREPGLPDPAAPRPAPAVQAGGLPAPASRPAGAAGGGVVGGGGGPRQPAPGPRPAPGSAQFPPERPSDEPTNAEIAAPQPSGGGKPAAPVEGGVVPPAQPPAAAPTGGAGAGGAAQPGSVPKPPAVAGTEFQVPYVPRSDAPPFGTLIPKNIAGGVHAALDKLVARVGPIDEFVADRLNMEVDELRNVMAAEQIDGVALAIDQIETGGEALIIGDETGIGKGRQGAALIRYAILNGKVPVFFTKDPKLFTDMYGDLLDIHTEVRPLIFGDPGKASIVDAQGRVVHRAPGPGVQARAMQEVTERGLAAAGYNAIFATYSQVNMRNARQEFLERIAEANPTIVILDEAHEAAGNATDSMQAAFISGGQVQRGSGANRTTIAVPGLLRRAGTLPGQGGVLYMSATFAKRPENMPVYFRTALGRSAQSFAQVVDAMKRGGVALQQAVSEALAKAGQYIRRERDFTGVSFEVKQPPIADPAKLVEDIDAVTDVLGEIVRFSAAMKTRVQGSTAQTQTQIDMTDFASVVHNQISQLLLAAKADHIVADAIAAVKKGEKPLVSVSNTMESFLDHYVADNGIRPGQEIKLRWNELLKFALERTLRVTEKLPNGDTRIYKVDPDEFGLGDYYRQIQSLADAVESRFPISPIDYIVQKLAKAGVRMSELTGRTSGIEYRNFETGEGIYRVFPRANKNRVVNGFNNGDVEGMLLNASGSTGLSAHASVKFRDKRPRHMQIGQAAADINVFVQTLGRIKRTGMVSEGTNPDGSKYGAKYTYMVLPLQAELRPAAMASRKMKSLNANTTAEAAGTVKIDAEDIYNRYGDLVVSEYLGANPEVQRLLGLGIDYNPDGSIEVKQDIARKFTGRQALLPDADQAAAYAEILPAYRQLIEQLKSTGDYDLEIVVHDDWNAQLRSDEELAAGTDPSNIFTAGLRVQQWEIADNRHVPTGAEIEADFKRRLGSKAKVNEDWRKFVERTEASFDKREADLADKLSKATDADRTKLELQRMSLREMRARWHGTQDRLADILSRTGDVVELSNTETGDSYEGMLTDVTFPKGMNVAPSAFRLRFGVNAPEGTIHLTGADLAHGKWALDYSDKGPADLTAGRAGQRANRYFVTGNPIQGFTATGGQGKMVRFKSQSGDVVTGLLMPRNWTPANLAHDPRFDLVSGRAVASFLASHGSDYVVEAKGIHRMGRGQQGYIISVPAARSTGGRVFLDRDLRNIVGEFVKTGNRMVARFDASQVQAAAERMQELLQARFRAVPRRGVSDPNTVQKVSDANQGATGGGPSGVRSFFSRRSEAQGLGEQSEMPTVEDVRRQRRLNREGTPVPPSPDVPTPPPGGPPEADVELGGEADIVDAIRRQDVMPGRDWIASPEFEFRNDPVAGPLVTRLVEAELAYQGQVTRDTDHFRTLRRGLNREARVRITTALRANMAGDDSALNALPEHERAVAQEIRRYFDEVRRAIIDAKQRDLIESLPEARAAAVHDILGGMDEADAFRAHRLRGPGQDAVRQALRELEELEHWGIDDYITNIERGSYRVVTPDGTTVAIAETRVAAKEKALRYARENPSVTRLTITDEFASSAAFPTKLTRGQYFRMAQRAAAALGTDVREIQRMLRAEGSPVVVIKPASKFAGPMQHRRNILKGEDDIFDALPAYAYSVRKKLALDPVLKQARIDLANLAPNTQKQVEALIDDVRGRYSLSDQIADYILAPFGTKPFAFSRGVGNVRTIIAMLKLGWRPTTALINRLGGIQHTWTKTGARYWIAGKRFAHSPEFRDIWHRNADLVGATAQAFLEAGHSEVPWYHPLAMFQFAERLNRPEAFAAFYRYAEGELALRGEEAEAFARNAVRAGQFTYTLASLPRILRTPPGRLIGQFKAYLVKEMEFVASLRGTEWVRYLTAFLAMGGPRAFIYFLRSLPFLGAIGALWALEDWLNRKAPRASRGLPGYAGVDVGPAVTPQLPKTASDWMGPALSDAWKLWDTVIGPAMQGEDRDLNDVAKWGAKLAPTAAYWGKMLEAIGNREGWMTDDQGRPLYKPTAADKAKLALGAKPLAMAVGEVDRAFLSRVNEIAKKNRTRLVNQILDALEKGDGVTLDKLMQDAAQYGIDSDTIKNAAKQRIREPDERLRRRLLKSVRVQEAERLSQPPAP